MRENTFVLVPLSNALLKWCWANSKRRHIARPSILCARRGSLQLAVLYIICHQLVLYVPRRKRCPRRSSREPSLSASAAWSPVPPSSAASSAGSSPPPRFFDRCRLLRAFEPRPANPTCAYRRSSNTARIIYQTKTAVSYSCFKFLDQV